MAWWTACLLWSSTFAFIRLGVSDVPPLTFASARLLIAVSILLPTTIARRGFRAVDRRDVAHTMAAGVLLLGVNYGLVYWGAQFVPSGLVAILQSATPVLALALGWLSGSETITGRKTLALAAAVLGVVAIFRSQAHVAGMRAVAGVAAVFASSACVAAAYVWMKHRGRRLPPLTVTTLQCLAGVVPLATLALLVEGRPTLPWSARALAAVLYLSVGGSVLAMWLNYWLLRRMDASAMLMMGLAEVPLAIALGAAVFGERLPPGILVGAACVMGGVILGPLSTRSAAAKGDRE